MKYVKITKIKNKENFIDIRKQLETESKLIKTEIILFPFIKIVVTNFKMKNIIKFIIKTIFLNFLILGGIFLYSTALTFKLKFIFSKSNFSPDYFILNSTFLPSYSINT